MKWSEVLLQKCYNCIGTGGGEVRIKFAPRQRENKSFLVPIVESYPLSQNICEEVEVKVED